MNEEIGISEVISALNLPTEIQELKGRKFFLFYPPGPMYQRGEDRSQGNISDSAATVMRAPNDMGYASSILKKLHCEVDFIDFQTEKKTRQDLLIKFAEYDPDVIIVSVTNSTIFSDIEIVNLLKKEKNNIIIILKGAIFFDSPPEVIESLDLNNVDYLIGGEIEFAIGPLAEAIYVNSGSIDKIPGILHKDLEGDWKKNNFGAWSSEVDDIPFPDRSVIKNELYVRPDTGNPQATIVTSRGCPAACVYCLTPVISGKKVRFRDPEMILEELRDCYHNYGITDFFFRSDTFTINHDWVVEVCGAINNSELKGKIEWVANSRVRPLKENTLQLMKEAGCWLVAFGFESGSEETLKGVRKGASTKDNLRAARLAKEAGLKLYGFYLIGLPWEKKSHLEDTKKHILDIDADFIEVHIALPYYGTELYNIAELAGTLDNKILGKDYFQASVAGTQHLSSNHLIEFRQKLLLKYHLRPKYLLKKFAEAIFSPKILFNYVKFGLTLIFSNLR